MKRYLAVWAIGTAVMLLVVMAFNLFIDPHDLLGHQRIAGLNLRKPKTIAYTKAYQLAQHQPKTLVLGNSRAEVGFDPDDPAWPVLARPVLNLALPGRGIDATFLYLQQALISFELNGKAEPAQIILGLDFVDFLVDPRSSQKAPHFGDDGSRLVAAWISGEGSSRWLGQVMDIGQSSLSLKATLDSIQTVIQQRDPLAADLTTLGFNPMLDYQKLANSDGYGSLFSQKDAMHFRSYFGKSQDIVDYDGNISFAFDRLRAILQLCRQRGIAISLLLYPYHAHFLESIRISGHWAVFERWKKTLLMVVAEGNTEGEVPLFDFSVYDDYTTESIPIASDRESRVRWYWEAGHFKHELGHEMLRRVLVSPETRQAEDFGLRLSAGNISSHLTSQVRLGEQYRLKVPAELKALESQAVAAGVLHRGD